MKRVEQLYMTMEATLQSVVVRCRLSMDGSRYFRADPTNIIAA